MKGMTNILLVLSLLFAFSVGHCLSAENDAEEAPRQFFFEAQENRLPVVIGVKFDAAPFHAGQDVQADVTVVDDDGDNVSLEYIWKINDEVISEVSEEVLPSGYFKKGDQVQLDVIPFDDSGEGALFSSALIPVINAIPSIVSTPEGRFENGTFSYQVQAVDPDNDPIVYKLEESPEGLTLDEESGLMTWTPLDSQKGIFKVSVSATDSDGAFFTQSFTLEIGQAVGEQVK